jgi:serine/threonine protein kinase
MELTLQTNAEPIPGYRLLERLGRGGYGEVWKAEAPGGMHKAIKFVFGNLETTGEEARAAEQEYKSLNRVKTIRHPFLLSLERMEVIEGQLVIVMELADRNLFDRYQECVNAGEPGVPRAELLGYVDEAAEALDLMNLHHQIQHLDIKPQNLFLVHQHVKVADFGLAKDLEGAKAAVTGGMTPMYAPPETFEGWVSRQSDQYSLAIVYMEMLTGRRPFPGPSTKQLILQHLTATPDLSPLSSPDREAVGRALAKNPEDRFPTCKDFVKALRGDGSGRQAPASSPDIHIKPVTPTRETATPGAETTERRAADSRKSLPALVTRGGKAAQPGVLTTPKPRSKTVPTGEVGKSKNVVERKGNGSLFPAVIVGIGGMGQGVIKGLRQLILDQYQKPTLPHLRWLFIDTDPAAVEAAVAQTEPTALTQDEALLMRLKRPAHYLSRDGLPSVETWLPPGDLYRLPRTPVTDGVRGFGRLAMCDHYPLLIQRLRAMLESFQRPEPILEADRITGLGVRSTFPRVYLATSLAGGTGSGMFLDLAYILRREIRRLGFGDPHIIGLLGMPAYSADGRNARGLSNTRAALTELCHFGRPGSPYKAQFDTREPAIHDPAPAFERCALIRLSVRTDRGDQPADIAGHLAYADLFTPIGRSLHPDDRPPGVSPLTLVGVRRLSWPRMQLLRAASWLLAKQTLQSWYAPTPLPPGVVAAAIDAQWGERELDRPTLRAALEEHLQATFGGTAEDIVASALHEAGKAAGGLLSPKASFAKLVELLGRSGAEDADNPGELTRALASKVRSLAQQADTKLAAAVTSLIEQPGLRLPAAEEAVRILQSRLQQELNVADRHAAVAMERALQNSAPLLTQLSTLSNAQGAEAENALLDLLYRWAVSRIDALLARACANVYRVLVGNLPEFVREFNTLQSQLDAYVRQLDDAPPRGLSGAGVCRPIFPDDAGTITEAAARLVGSLDPKERRDFDTSLQARIRHECRGVVHACARMRDQAATFRGVLLDQSMKYLERRVPHMRASAALMMCCPGPAALTDKLREHVSSAAPGALGPEPAPNPTVALLGLPEDEASDRLAAVVRNCFPDQKFRTVTTADDVYIVTEVQNVAPAKLPHLATAAQGPTAADADGVPTAHTRADVSWVAVGAE